MTKDRAGALRAEIAKYEDSVCVDGFTDRTLTCGELRELLKAAELVLTMEEVAAERRGVVTWAVEPDDGTYRCPSCYRVMDNRSHIDAHESGCPLAPSALDWLSNIACCSHGANCTPAYEIARQVAAYLRKESPQQHRSFSEADVLEFTANLLHEHDDYARPPGDFHDFIQKRLRGRAARLHAPKPVPEDGRT